jgi:hypothetical protein
MVPRRLLGPGVGWQPGRIPLSRRWSRLSSRRWKGRLGSRRRPRPALDEHSGVSGPRTTVRRPVIARGKPSFGLGLLGSRATPRRVCRSAFQVALAKVDAGRRWVTGASSARFRDTLRRCSHSTWNKVRYGGSTGQGSDDDLGPRSVLPSKTKVVGMTPRPHRTRARDCEGCSNARPHIQNHQSRRTRGFYAHR